MTGQASVSTTDSKDLHFTEGKLSGVFPHFYHRGQHLHQTHPVTRVGRSDGADLILCPKGGGNEHQSNY